jgi:hypothetical protein
MQKAIYLGVVVAVTPIDTGADRLYELEMKIGQALRQTPHGLRGSVKRIRTRGDHIEATVYVQGEQEPPENFTRLAVAEAQQALETAFAAPLRSNAQAAIHEIYEDSSAVDDMADAGLV